MLIVGVAGCSGWIMSLSLSSSSSSKGVVMEAGGVGGRMGLGLERFLSLFDLSGRIAPAQPLIPFIFERRLAFFLSADHSVASPSEPTSEERRAESDELELIGRPFAGIPLLTKGSSPKNDHLFDDLVGLGHGGLIFDVSAIPIRVGIEFRRLGEDLGLFASGPAATRSKIAPAVLGRESFNSRVELREIGAKLSCSNGDVGDTTEEILPETE